MLSLSKVGENGLIDYLCRRLARKERNLFVGIGDDALVFSAGKKECLVVASDSLVEDVHFRRKWTNFQQLGWKAIAVVLSDFAAMGDTSPRYALVNLGLPRNFPFSKVEQLYSGMEKIARRWRLTIGGGDTTRAEKIFLTIFIVGEGDRNFILRREGARPGELIFSSGPLGEAAAGLSLLKKGYNRKDAHYRKLTKKFLLPEPRLKEGKILARNRLATSLVDCSDGLERSLRLLTEISNIGAEIYLENLPLTPELKMYLGLTEHLAKKMNSFWKLAVFGGEDYELIFTGREENYTKILKIIPSAFVLGRIRKEKGIRFSYWQQPTNLEGKSYDAFL